MILSFLHCYTFYILIFEFFEIFGLKFYFPGLYICVHSIKDESGTENTDKNKIRKNQPEEKMRKSLLLLVTG